MRWRVAGEEREREAERMQVCVCVRACVGVLVQVNVKELEHDGQTLEVNYECFID